MISKPKSFIISVVLLFACLAVVVTWMRSCGTETLNRSAIRNRGGYDFEIVDTVTGWIGSAEYISVYVSHAQDVLPWYERPFRKKTLLFVYDPGDEDEAHTPRITVPNSKEIVISVSRVSSVFQHEHRWNDVAVRYEIGKIDFPN